jgi:hypothetical protein
LEHIGLASTETRQYDEITDILQFEYVVLVSVMTTSYYRCHHKLHHSFDVSF